MICVDTSVVVAAMSPWHEVHEVAANACRQDAVIPAHCLIEAFAALTRMRDPLQVTGADAAEALTRQWGDRQLVLPEDVYTQILDELARKAIIGSHAYDGLTALTARHFNLRLVSLDHRAERTYKSLGIDYSIID